jgi:hypothetical protein
MDETGRGSYLGGPGNEYAEAIKLDSQGYIYIAGADAMALARHNAGRGFFKSTSFFRSLLV